MSFKVIHGQRPPNFGAILAVFPEAAGPNVVFAYGDCVYNPSGILLAPEIRAHEKVHCDRMAVYPGGAPAWWDRYLVDLEFRYIEELLAHRAEYQHLCQQREGRPWRRRCLGHVAKKLSAPLYGRMVTMEQAKRDLKNDNAR